jgi:hypothetical protein
MLRPISNEHYRLMQGAHIQSYGSSVSHLTYSFYMHNATYKKQGAFDWRFLNHLTYAYYMCSATYKKQGAPDWWFLNHLTYAFYMRSAAYKK